MKRLDPSKLHVSYLAGTGPDRMELPRRYTLTHSDRTGQLFLSVGSDFNTPQVSGIYTRLVRDEVLAELSRGDHGLRFSVYCHVSGGFVFGPARWRYNIFQSELPLVLEAIRYGDRALFQLHPELDATPVLIHFHSTSSRFHRVEDWGTMARYS